MIPRRSVVPSNSASSTTSSASSVSSSSKASPRHHQKSPAPQAPFSDSTHPTHTQPSKVKQQSSKGETREHSPRRPGEDLPDLTGRVRTLSQHYLDLAISQEQQTPISRNPNQVMRRSAKSLKTGRRRPMSQFFLPSKPKDGKKENINTLLPKDFPNLEGVSVSRLSRSFHINTNNCHEQRKVTLKQKGRSLMQKSAKELQSLKLKFQGVDSSPEAKTIPEEGNWHDLQNSTPCSPPTAKNKCFKIELKPNLIIAKAICASFAKVCVCSVNFCFDRVDSPLFVGDYLSDHDQLNLIHPITFELFCIYIL